MISRRGLITGLISFAAAPAIVRIESLMPVKVMEPIVYIGWDLGIKDLTVAAYYWLDNEGKIHISHISTEEFYK